MKRSIDDWKRERLEMAGVLHSGLARSEVLQKLHRGGHTNITSHDITWATKVGLIKPIIVADNLYLYNDEDVVWLEALSRLKLGGIDKPTIEKLLSRELLSDIIDVTRRININASGEL